MFNLFRTTHDIQAKLTLHNVFVQHADYVHANVLPIFS